MKNDRTLKILVGSLLFFPALLILSFVISLAITPVEKAKDEYRNGNKSISESDLTRVIQDWRSSQKLKNYTVDPLLCGFANKRADEIFVEGNKMSHEGLAKYQDQLFQVYDGYSENLAKNWSPELMLDWWLHSASHEANLRRDRPLTCVKCKGYYCVQLFATPK